MFWQNTVIVGAGDVGQLIARKLRQHPEYAIRLVGFVDETPREPRSDLGELRLLGSPDVLPELVERFNIDRVIVAYSSESHEALLWMIHKLKARSVQIDLVPRLFEAVGPKVDMHTVEALPLIGLPPPGFLPRRASPSAHSTSLSRRSRSPSWPRSLPSSRGGSSETRTAPSSSVRRGSD